MKTKAINSKMLGVLLAIFIGFINWGVASADYHQPGMDCTDCHDMHGGTSNLKLIAKQIPEGWNLEEPIEWKTVEFLIRPDHYADGYGARICEVCHEDTNYYTTYGTSPGGAHHLGEDCMSCHSHCDEFRHGAAPGPGCDQAGCHGHDGGAGTVQSHSTHTENDADDLKGPNIACGDCHDTDNFPYFKSGIGDPPYDLSEADVCDECHSQGGAFDGVAEAKAKWEDGVYESNGYELKAGNENWCATCHDEGTSTVNGVDAPNVMGNSTTYGYNVSGHGEYAVRCEDCHDLALLHTDGEARTYSAASGNYRAGYRLNESMAVPRDGETHPEAFRLCTNCHFYSSITGAASRFRDDGTGKQYHDMHLNSWPALYCSDSDFDGVGCSTGACVDSAMTCINCHNVHGPPAPAMIRHGELISTPGTSDKVPALRFRWYKADGVTQTTVLRESRYGSLICGSQPDVSVNHVCFGCHGTGELKWHRLPLGPRGITLKAVWTTDTSDVTKTQFYPTEALRLHCRFTLVGTGTGPYFVRITNSAIGNSASMPGTNWSYQLRKQGTIGSGTFEVQWQGNIPGTADPGSPAKVRIRIYVFDSEGGALLDQDEMIWDFSIVAGP